MQLLDASHGLLIRHDVAREIRVAGLEQHPLTVVELAAGKVVGDLRLVATRDDVVVGGLQTLFGCDDPGNHYALKRRRLRQLKFRRGTAILLGVANSDNYYHWLMDAVPRWKILLAANILKYDFVLLPGQPSQFQEETLDRLKVPPEKRLRCSKNLVHQFDRLVVPSMGFPLEEVTPWACEWVRSLFPEKISGPGKIYLTRRGAGRRRLVNESEIETILVSRGFTIIQPEQLSVAEQAGIFRSSRWVVAPHGAALTNVVFMEPGGSVVELFHPRHKNRCYVNLAAVGGHRYASLDGYITNNTGDRQLEYRIDVASVLEILEQIN